MCARRRCHGQPPTGGPRNDRATGPSATSSSLPSAWARNPVRQVELRRASYLLSSFLNRCATSARQLFGRLDKRLPILEIIAAMRAALPQHMPMSGGSRPTTGPAIRASARQAFETRSLRPRRADLIDVSAGQTWAEAQPVYGRMFQTPFSDKLRNEARVATMAVGNIYEPDHANSILAAGRADLVALGRPHLIDPMWTLRAAAALDYRDIHVPPQYLNGQAQLARNLKREAAAALRA